MPVLRICGEPIFAADSEDFPIFVEEHSFRRNHGGFDTRLGAGQRIGRIEIVLLPCLSAAITFVAVSASESPFRGRRMRFRRERVELGNDFWLINSKVFRLTWIGDGIVQLTPSSRLASVARLASFPDEWRSLHRFPNKESRAVFERGQPTFHQ